MKPESCDRSAQWNVFHRGPEIAVGRIVAEGPAVTRAGTTGPWPALVFPRHPVWVGHDAKPDRYLDPTVVAFVNAQSKGMRQSDQPDGECIDWVAFEGALAASMVQPFEPKRKPDPLAPFRIAGAALPPAACLQQRTLFAYCTDCAQVDPVLVEECALVLLGAALRSAYGRRPPRGGAKTERTTRTHRAMVTEARRFIAKHLESRLTLSAIAQQVHAAPQHFCRIFRSETGLTIGAYVNRLRLYQILDELPAESTSYDLAERFGFADRAHFSRHFTRLFGRSFQGVRRLLRAGKWSEMRTIVHAENETLG